MNSAALLSALRCKFPQHPSELQPEIQHYLPWIKRLLTHRSVRIVRALARRQAERGIAHGVRASETILYGRTWNQRILSVIEQICGIHTKLEIQLLADPEISFQTHVDVEAFRPAHVSVS